MKDLLNKSDFTKEEIVRLLKADKEERNLLFAKSAEIKEKTIGKTTYYRGLIEFSNECAKNCLYCGIRSQNTKVERYTIPDKEILEAAKFAYENNYASLVLQGGELSTKKFTSHITKLLREIKKLSNNKLGITLSVGEQSYDTYKEWFDAGAHRYLLRIESSNEELYYKIHPQNKAHDFETRLNALKTLQEIGYQTGTGVMIGLPYQTYEDLADDLLFMKNFDIDMVGMGPYIEHQDTPLYDARDLLQPLEARFTLTLKMISILRILMPDINIAAATAMQAIDKLGREKALKVGANIIMPNITPGKYRDDYSLYENKPCTDEEADDCKNCLEARITIAGDDIGYGEWGDSKHYYNRRNPHGRIL